MKPALVPDGHSFRVRGFLSGHPFQPSQEPPIIAQAALHREPVLLVAVGPSQADVVILRTCSKLSMLPTERE